MATNQQHTPGPWQKTQFLDCAQQFKISDTSGFLIANVGIQHLHAREMENEANAHLIAAAPELLAELREVCAQYDALLAAHGKPFGWGRIVTDKAREIVAKAEGQS